MEAQNNNAVFTLEAEIPTQKGNKLYFGQYWNGATYALDSTIISDEGKATFSIKKDLDEGQYFLYTNSSFQIDLLIGNNDKQISVFIDENDLSTKKVTGSNDSKTLWEYLAIIQDIDKFRDMVKNPEPGNSDSILSRTEHSLKNLESKFEAYKNLLFTQNKDTWASVFIKGLDQAEIPYPNPKTVEEATKNRDYGKIHFFDNINLSDPRMWRTNYFTSYIDSYMEQWVEQIPDTLAAAASRLVAKTKGNEICFKEMLSKLTNDAIKSVHMGDENIWVRLFEDYILNKNLSWIKDSEMTELKSMYEKAKNNLIGSKGFNLNLITVDGDSISTDEIQAKYLLLYFYDPDCGYCRTETPKLHDELYKKYKDKGLEILAINVASDEEAWKELIDTNKLTDWINCSDPDYKSEYWLHYDISGVPMIYVLDKNKKIIAKKVDEVNLEKLFKHIIGN
jgi:peroxiredoxin